MLTHIRFIFLTALGLLGVYASFFDTAAMVIEGSEATLIVVTVLLVTINPTDRAKSRETRPVVALVLLILGALLTYVFPQMLPAGYGFTVPGLVEIIYAIWGTPEKGSE